MSNCPTEIITEILSRLPVKSLLRYRRVSKPWCALIDGPDLMEMHLKRSIDTNSNLTIILQGICPPCSLEFDSLDKKPIEFETPFYSPRFNVLGSCNGLLLIRSYHITLFNPSTKKYRKLPETRVENPDFHVGHKNDAFAFGYDCINDDYKVIRIVEFRTENYGWISSETKIYSLKSNSWRRIRDNPYRLPVHRAIWWAQVGGALHTTCSSHTTSTDFVDLIVAFDIGVEDWYLVPLPECLDKSFFMTVRVLGGCLCLVSDCANYRTDIWVMKDYGVKGSWTKLLSIGSIVEPLLYSKDGGEILLNDAGRRLIWYDLMKKTVRNVPARDLPLAFCALVFVGSLVPLGKFDEIKKQNGQVKKEGTKKNQKRDDFLSTGFKLKL